MKKLVLNISLSLLALLVAISCNIKEDISDCPGSMILDYSAYSDMILDDIEDDEQVDVFIFNPSGICCDIRTFTYGELSAVGFEFELPITYRGYNAVVWQGLDSENYTSRRMVLGESYENFYLRLVYDTIEDCSCMPDPLWASELEPIDYCAKITRHRVYMTRLHTEVYVSVQKKYNDGSDEYLDPEEFSPIISAVNDVYHTDYEVSEESILLEYTEDEDEEGITPFALAETDACSCVGTLRITPDMFCVLEVEDENGDNISIGGSEQLDLVSYMLATKDDASLTDQEFLDLNKVWEINLVVEEQNVGYVAVSLTINGWVVWFSSSELD